MKIIVMNSADLRIEFFNVADELLNDDVERFLVEHNVSLKNAAWMAAPIDYVTVLMHDICIDEESGEGDSHHAPSKIEELFSL